jgi:fructose-1,6-bisphosphatase/sedoheptulose 1,7-bisphosphatase-like protein
MANTVEAENTAPVSGWVQTPESLEREIVNVMARACSVAALNAAHARGRNNVRFVGELAMNAMRAALQDGLPIPSEIVLGENAPDLGPVLFTGERLGPDGEPQLLLALDPLEGSTLCARGEPGAITVAAGALAGHGQLMGNVDGYFDKIVVGKDLAKRVLAMKETGGPYFYVKVNETHGLIDNSTEDIVRWIAYVRQKPVSEVVAMVLERERNYRVIEELRRLNVQVLLIKDGDTTAGLLALDPKLDVDVALGIGAAPEGVITAAICRVFQGYMEARWWLGHPEKGAADKARLLEQKIDPRKLLTVDDLAGGHVMFALTGVTYNQYTPGVQYGAGGTAITHTIYGRSRSGTIYERRAIHQNPPPPPEYPK